MVNQGQQTAPQAAEATPGGAPVYHDMAAGDSGDDDELMGGAGAAAPHYEDRAAEIERLRAQAEAE
eukprot:3773869-Heterocapsa_arctica.AAC.1